MDKAKLLDRASASAEERMLLARVLDKYEQARQRNLPTETGFLSPQEQAAAKALLAAAGVRDGFCFYGGYEGAERCKLLFAPDWMEVEELPAQCGITAVQCRFYEGDKLSHRDFLGSLMGLGLVREKIGDILVRSGSAVILADTSVEEFLLREYISAGRTKLSVSALPLAELIPPEKKQRDIRDTVMSLRLDSVTESHIQSAFDELARGRTTLIIAHRLSTIRKADRIVVVQDGQITEAGSHEELMKLGGAYSELYRTQTEIYG